MATCPVCRDEFHPLSSEWLPFCCKQCSDDGVAELDRLRAVNAELLAALVRGAESLEDAIQTADEQVPPGWIKYNSESLEMMRAAIARAEDFGLDDLAPEQRSTTVVEDPTSYISIPKRSE